MTDEFCDECGVSMSLHNDEDDCENAQAKADVIVRFWAVGRVTDQ